MTVHGTRGRYPGYARSGQVTPSTGPADTGIRPPLDRDRGAAALDLAFTVAHREFHHTLLVDYAERASA
ncbi:hypothetical protein [Streptomyces seoulensis]|uniref:hypothetical protein n=1 Tax=Streptomyces seoulensis TaxID=73044 RepID=UPI0033A013D6